MKGGRGVHGGFSGPLFRFLNGLIEGPELAQPPVDEIVSLTHWYTVADRFDIESFGPQRRALPLAGYKMRRVINGLFVVQPLVSFRRRDYHVSALSANVYAWR